MEPFQFRRRITAHRDTVQSVGRAHDQTTVTVADDLRRLRRICAEPAVSFFLLPAALHYGPRRRRRRRHRRFDSVGLGKFVLKTRVVVTGRWAGVGDDAVPKP